MRTLDLNALARFAVVVEEGGFSPAARALGMPRQSIHRSVVKLEEQAGVRLIERSSRHVRPTDAGRRLYAHAKEIVNQAQQARVELEASSGEPSGLLRLTSSHLMAESFVSDAIPVFLERWPRVSIDAHFTVTVTDLLRDDFDVAIRASTDLPPSMYAKRLGAAQTVCCATPNFLASVDTLDDPHQLARHAVLAYGSRGSHEHWWFSSEGETLEVMVQPRFRCDSAGAARQACLADLGILRIPRMAVHHQLSTGALVEVLAPWRPAETPIWAVYPSRSDHNPAMRAFLEVLVECIEASGGI